MEATRSRKPSPLTTGSRSTDGCCGRTFTSNTASLLLPPTFSGRINSNIMNEDKKPCRSIQMIWVLLSAVAGTLVFTILLSLNAHFKQSVVGTFNLTPSSTGRLKNHEWPIAQQQFKAMPEAVVRPNESARQDHDHDPSTKGSRNANEDHSLRAHLLDDFNKFGPAGSCASRGHSSTKYTPTVHLIQSLRRYESFHRKCAGHAKDFVNNNIRLHKGRSEADHGGCRFVVWIAYGGLGNRMLSLVSTFLYALLTNRILLVDKSTDMRELFCEPFPGTSWLVPLDFPQSWLEALNESSDQRFGNLFNKSVPSPAFSYVHLTHTYNLDDRRFFCDQGQDYLYPIPWLFMRGNNYVVPGLYFLSAFRPQLDELFTEKEAIFHLLGRYLFHPSNIAWGWIRRFQSAYLANNEKKVGIQIRTFNDTPQAYFQEQLSQCALENRVLPNVTNMEPDYMYSSGGSDLNASASSKLTSILVTSLQPEYYEKLRDFYMSAPTQDGQFVAVHQPSHEGWQKTDTFSHDLRAWADIYLLSVSDVLITSGWSTFGYAAQALAGVKPWILFRSFNRTVPNPPCTYARSIEPCFHTPPLMDCQNHGFPRNPAKLLPFVQSCEDIPWGIKLIEADSAVTKV